MALDGEGTAFAGLEGPEHAGAVGAPMRIAPDPKPGRAGGYVGLARHNRACMLRVAGEKDAGLRPLDDAVRKGGFRERKAIMADEDLDSPRGAEWNLRILDEDELRDDKP